MIVGIISDTHGDINAMLMAVNAIGNADVWIHLGDYVRDAKELEKIVNKPVYFVKGNCDYGVDADTEKVVELDGKRILLVHGHLHHVKTDLQTLAYRAEELNCDVALYGHTHCSDLTAYGKIIIMNPGSPSQPRMGMHGSCAVLIIKDGNIYPKICLV